MDQHIAITGTGICTSIGQSRSEVLQSLLSSRSGIGPYHGDGHEPMVSHYAARCADFQLRIGERESSHRDLGNWWDRATQMAVEAASDAFEDAKLNTLELEETRIGLAVGVSGAGQFAPDRSVKMKCDSLNSEIAHLLMRRNTPHFQLYQLARWLRISGPMTCISSASAASGIAIGNGIRWLLSNQADAVLAGGSEAIMLLNFLGFDTLGLLSPEPCAPFSGSKGMTMGEGAAYLLLERWEDAVARGAEIRGALLGFGVTSDAFDPILYDPSGEGIRRAMEGAMEDASISRSDIGWIRASGAGTKDQDASEIMAIRHVFGNSIPPVSSLEATFGHCNGAGPAIGLVAAIESQRQGWIPATLHFQETPCEDIDFVPNVPKENRVEHFLSNTAAFGGTNVVLVGGVRSHPQQGRPFDEIVITGMGIVSGFGCAGFDFMKEIGTTPSFIGVLDREDVSCLPDVQAAEVRNFSFRKEVPFVPTRGLDRLTQFAAAAARRAISESELGVEKLTSDRLGVVTGVSHTSGALLERLIDELQGPWGTPTMGRTLLNKGRFLVTSRLAHWFGCKGYNATHSIGIGSGLLALNQAYEQLRQSRDNDAILVVAADEVSPMQLNIASKLGWLAPGNRPMLPYRDESGGMVLGEGAVALVIEKRSSASQRGYRGGVAIEATSTSLDAIPFQTSRDHDHLYRNLDREPSGKSHIFAIREGLRRSQLDASSIDFVLGTGYGISEADRRELKVVDAIWGSTMPFGSTTSLHGLMISSGTLFGLCFSIAAMHDARARNYLNEHVLLQDRSSIAGNCQRAAILATSEDGQNVMTILRKCDSPS